MFRGRYEHILDPKGRVKLPSRFWDILQNDYDNHLVITIFDECLLAYPVKEWTLVEEKIGTLPTLKREVRDFNRFFLGNAADCDVDKQRRILIPPSLRRYAGLKRDVVFLGLNNRFEIWAQERIDPQMEAVPEKFEHIAAALPDLSF
jgi:MraZ protein